MPTRYLGSGFVGQVLPAILYTVFVFVAGSLPASALPGPSGMGLDKIGHFFVFALMHVLFSRAARAQLPAQSQTVRSLVAALGALLVGGVLELYQAALPYRSAEWLDWVADLLGIAAAALIPVRWVVPSDP